MQGIGKMTLNAPIPPQRENDMNLDVQSPKKENQSKETEMRVHKHANFINIYSTVNSL